MLDIRAFISGNCCYGFTTAICVVKHVQVLSFDEKAGQLLRSVCVFVFNDSVFNSQYL